MSQAATAGSPPARFLKLDSAGQSLPQEATEWDAVLDTTTNLTWSVKETRAIPQPKAPAAAQKLTTCGFDNWRLPTRTELLTLVDDTRYSPAIDTTFFPNCQSGWYWTSTRAASSPGGCAWVVGFGYGYAGWFGQDLSGFVRAVRVGQ